MIKINYTRFFVKCYKLFYKFFKILLPTINPSFINSINFIQGRMAHFPQLISNPSITLNYYSRLHNPN